MNPYFCMGFFNHFTDDLLILMVIINENFGAQKNLSVIYPTEFVKNKFTP